jgi:hypothetical protein
MKETKTESNTETPTIEKASFAEAFKFWLKLGFISFGGPAGQIAIMHRELVERKKWVDEERIFVCFCRDRKRSSLPLITGGGFTARSADLSRGRFS